MARCSHRGAATRSRRAFLQAAGATGAAVLASQLLPVPRARGAIRPRPNLVFLLGEGARWDESSLAGNRLLKTPNIDRIGREGAVFTDAFCVNSLCLPARATILSGLYSHTTGAVDNQHSKVPDRFPIVTDLIRSHGYEVAFIGKSHVQGSLMDRYWDYYFGFSGQADYQCPVWSRARTAGSAARKATTSTSTICSRARRLTGSGRSTARRSVCFCGSTRRTRRSIDP
jgi:arylsulfatase A-like enzyme